MASSESAAKTCVLTSSDGETLEVEERVAMVSKTLRRIIEDVGTDNRIPVTWVHSKILAKVIDYCKKHVESASKAKADDKDGIGEDDLKAWDADFVTVDYATLFDLVLAANYLDIQSLLDLTCQTVVDMIKGKTPEEVRSMFNIKNVFTPEEEEQVRKENQWAFE